MSSKIVLSSLKTKLYYILELGKMVEISDTSITTIFWLGFY